MYSTSSFSLVIFQAEIPNLFLAFVSFQVFSSKTIFTRVTFPELLSSATSNKVKIFLAPETAFIQRLICW
ncbi:Uncharacterised protein, partial [Mycoplasmopsis synoviae]